MEFEVGKYYRCILKAYYPGWDGTDVSNSKMAVVLDGKPRKCLRVDPSVSGRGVAFEGVEARNDGIPLWFWEKEHFEEVPAPEPGIAIESVPIRSRIKIVSLRPGDVYREAKTLTGKTGTVIGENVFGRQVKFDEAQLNAARGYLSIDYGARVELLAAVDESATAGVLLSKVPQGARVRVLSINVGDEHAKSQGVVGEIGTVIRRFENGMTNVDFENKKVNVSCGFVTIDPGARCEILSAPRQTATEMIRGMEAQSVFMDEVAALANVFLESKLEKTRVNIKREKFEYHYRPREKGIRAKVLGYIKTNE